MATPILKTIPTLLMSFMLLFGSASQAVAAWPWETDSGTKPTLARQYFDDIAGACRAEPASERSFFSPFFRYSQHADRTGTAESGVGRHRRREKGLYLDQQPCHCKRDSNIGHFARRQSP